MTQQNNIKWVKASERLPEKEGDLFPIRYGINFQTLSTGYYEQGHWYLAHNHAKLFLRNQLEWLEELPVSSPEPSEREGKAEENRNTKQL